MIRQQPLDFQLGITKHLFDFPVAKVPNQRLSALRQVRKDLGPAIGAVD